MSDNVTVISISDAQRVLRHVSEKLEDQYIYFGLDLEDYMIPLERLSNALDVTLDMCISGGMDGD